jgi:hypothetical protein
MTCPPFSELCAAHAATALHEHLETCPRCRAIVARVKTSEAALGAAPKAPARPASHAGPAPRAGGVWTFWAPSSDEYLVGAVLDADDTELLIVPLLMESDWASEEDVLLPADILGYPAVAPVWAGDHVLVEQAAEAVDILSEEHVVGLQRAYDAFFAGESIAAPTGPPVLGEGDPRIDAHAATADDLRSFYAPWAMLQSADELGPVMAHRREELDIDLEPWSELVKVDAGDWSAFEAGKASPDERIPVTALGRAIRELGLLPSRRVVQLAHASVQAHGGGDGVREAPARARRRRGVVPAEPRDPEAARAAADRFAAALAKELGL